MGQETSIEWTESSWNPIRGCSRISQGCVNCYAETQAARWSGAGGPYEGLINDKRRWNGVVRMVPEHLDDPLRWRRPRMVFVNSMSDLFHESLTNEQIASVFAVMAAAPHHTFQVLTKRSARMVEWFRWLAEEAPLPSSEQYMRDNRISRERSRCVWEGWRAGAPLKDWLPAMHGSWPLPNVWVGVSVESQRVVDRVEHLSQVPAAVRWVSAEPLIGRLDLDGSEWNAVDWVVVGGESGPGARECSAAWIADVVQACTDAGVPVFVKQLGAAFWDDKRRIAGPRLPSWPGDSTIRVVSRTLKHPKGGDMAEWPSEFQVRQWPKAGGAQ